MVNPDCLRGNDFLNKFIPMLQGMIDLGFTKEQALTALSTQQYVRDFADTPDWFVSAPKLPKGCKWADGAKYHKKATTTGATKADAETYVFLIIEEDIYIKGFYSTFTSYVRNENDELELYKAPKALRDKICIIKNWKEVNANNVIYKLDMTPFFSNSLLNFYAKNGGEIGLTNKIAKDVRKV